MKQNELQNFNPFAMHSPSHPTPARLSVLPVAALLALSLSACAAGPGEPKPRQSAAPVTHNCKPQETVGFSCELRDHRLLSLCGSPGFNQFEGEPKDNPGYAYVAIGTQQGKVQFLYPQNPQDYKKYMTFSMSLAGAWPHMFVNTDKGRFLHFSLDTKEPVDADPENAPQDWPLRGLGERPLCARKVNRDHIDSFMSRMIEDPEWVKNRGWNR
jgi:hypothetical protein